MASKSSRFIAANSKTDTQTNAIDKEEAQKAVMKDKLKKKSKMDILYKTGDE